MTGSCALPRLLPASPLGNSCMPLLQQVSLIIPDLLSFSTQEYWQLDILNTLFNNNTQVKAQQAGKGLYKKQGTF